MEQLFDVDENSPRSVKDCSEYRELCRSSIMQAIKELRLNVVNLQVKDRREEEYINSLRDREPNLDKKWMKKQNKSIEDKIKSLEGKIPQKVENKSRITNWIPILLTCLALIGSVFVFYYMQVEKSHEKDIAKTKVIVQQDMRIKHLEEMNKRFKK